MRPHNWERHSFGAWLQNAAPRLHRNKLATALANKLARIADGILSEEFIRALHKRMFGDVWKWAGSHRQSERNIGIDAYRIANELGALPGDVKYWIEHETYPPDEIAIRFHHCLVAIHPFPNGNGRHARLMADLLIELLDGEPFSWGGGHLTDVGNLRMRYVAALQAADKHDIAALLEFARS